MKALIGAFFILLFGMCYSAGVIADTCTPDEDAAKAYCEQKLQEAMVGYNQAVSLGCSRQGNDKIYGGKFTWVRYDGMLIYTSAGQGYFDCPNPPPPPPPTCSAGTFTSGVWLSPGASTGCSGGCETTPTFKTDDGITRFGMSTTGNQCPATNPPPNDSNSNPPHPGYTPDDPNDPSKGGQYCDETGKYCTHGAAPNTGGDGGSNPPSSSTSGTPPSGGTGTGGNPAGGSSTGTPPSGGTGGTGTGGTGTGGTGTGGTGTGGNGSGAPASGSSSGGKGDGKCTAGDACDNGSAAGTPTFDYTSSTETVAGVYGTFKDHVASSPLISTVKSMFTISVGGQCPVWVVPASAFTPTLVFDYLCKSPLAGVLAAAGYIVLATAVFYAIKIAIY